MTPDPFGARAMRERVLASWASAPARFREDANAEEDLALNGYRDRVIVELAQNAADAASRAGVPGRLLLRLAHDNGHAVLVAANTGTPLDAEGVQGLATLRASSKSGISDLDPVEQNVRHGRRAGHLAVGRFGVGFSAVLTVTDEPVVLSRTGGVRFSAADSRALVDAAIERSPDQASELRSELTRRGGHVPVLRLPFEAEGSPPAGFDTAVVLPLRDAAAEEVVQRRLAEVGDALLLALPALESVTIDVSGEPTRIIEDVAARWRVWRTSGTHDPASLADRPTEERRRTTWQVTWALPRSAQRSAGWQPSGAGVVHAPTPTDEPLDWPGLLIGSFPLDSTRRHVALGAATDTLVDAAAQLYVEALHELAESGRDVLPFVPIGFASGALDGAMRVRVLELLPGAAVLRVVEPHGEPALIKPRDAVAIEPPAGAEDEILAALAPSLAGLVRARRAEERVLRRLGVGFLPVAEVIESLPEHDDLEHWRALYTALAPLAGDPLMREAMSSLPVPLVDGRIVRGARGLLLLPLGTEASTGASTGAQAALGALGVLDDRGGAYTLLGLRAVHPAVAHELLERLGAVPAGPRAVLEQPSVRAAVEESPEADDPLELAHAVLILVSAAAKAGELQPGDLPWLGDLALLDTDDELAPASALALPGSVAAALLDAGEVGLVRADLIDRWGRGTLAAAGVLDELALLRIADLVPAALDGASPIGGPELADLDFAELDFTGGAPAAGDVLTLDGFEQWWDGVADLVERAGADAADATIPDFVAVSDLDAIRPAALEALLTHVTANAATRSALIGPTRVVAGRRAIDVPTYTAWWLSRRVARAGRFADPEADPLVARLLPEAPAAVRDLDVAARAALGAVRSVEQLDADAVAEVLQRLAVPETALSVDDVIAAYAGVGRIAAESSDMAALMPQPPHAVRVIDPEAPTGTSVVPADEAVVVSMPMHLQRAELGLPIVVGEASAEALATLLDVRLASDQINGTIDGEGGPGARRVTAPPEIAALLGRRELGWCEHDELIVDGVDVDWWVDADGAHAATADGLARAIAWSCGRWQARHAVALLLAEPGSSAEILVDEAFG